MVFQLATEKAAESYPDPYVRETVERALKLAGLMEESL